MGRYFNPVQDLETGQVGRSLDGSFRNFSALRVQMRPGEHLYIILDNLVRKIAPCVDEESEFTYFLGKYKAGWFVNLQPVALSEKEHQMTN